MTWQIEYEIPWDADGDTSVQKRAFYEYFMDVYLPSKGWSVYPRPGDDATSRYRILQRNFNDAVTGVPRKDYLWYDLTTERNYEDATYNVTPGDKGTDSTNHNTFTVTSSSAEWGRHSYIKLEHHW